MREKMFSKTEMSKIIVNLENILVSSDDLATDFECYINALKTTFNEITNGETVYENNRFMEGDII